MRQQAAPPPDLDAKAPSLKSSEVQRLNRKALVFLAGIIALMLLVVFAVTVAQPVMVVPLVFLWGIASFALVPPLQAMVVQEAAEAPSLASAMNIGAFNLGNALGAMLGALMISAGFGLSAVPLAGAATAAVGLAMVLWFRRGRQQGPAAVTAEQGAG